MRQWKGQGISPQYEKMPYSGKIVATKWWETIKGGFIDDHREQLCPSVAVSPGKYSKKIDT